jgi:allophanate hydrolase subunit 1
MSAYKLLRFAPYLSKSAAATTYELLSGIASVLVDIDSRAYLTSERIKTLLDRIEYLENEVKTLKNKNTNAVTIWQCKKSAITQYQPKANIKDYQQ